MRLACLESNKGPLLLVTMPCVAADIVPTWSVGLALRFFPSQRLFREIISLKS